MILRDATQVFSSFLPLLQCNRVLLEWMFYMSSYDLRGASYFLSLLKCNRALWFCSDWLSYRLTRVTLLFFLTPPTMELWFYSGWGFLIVLALSYKAHSAVFNKSTWIYTQCSVHLFACQYQQIKIKRTYNLPPFCNSCCCSVSDIFWSMPLCHM